MSTHPNQPTNRRATMNPMNSIAIVVRKVFMAELKSLVHEIADDLGVDRDSMVEKYVNPKLDTYKIRRKPSSAVQSGDNCVGRRPQQQPQHHHQHQQQQQQQHQTAEAAPETAIIEAREVVYNNHTFLVDVNTGMVYTNDFDNPMHVGDVLADGSILMHGSGM